VRSCLLQKNIHVFKFLNLNVLYVLPNFSVARKEAEPVEEEEEEEEDYEEEEEEEDYEEVRRKNQFTF
jgi:hypothetical protein